MRLTNKTPGDLGLATGETVPARGHLVVDAGVLDANMSSAVVAAWIESGMLVASEQDDEILPDPAEINSTSGDSRSREEVVTEAMKQIIASDDKSQITADGKPKADAINQILVAAGFEPTNSEERDALWALMN